MTQIPEIGYLRLKQIVGDNKSIPAIIPISKTSWWEGIKQGKYPKGIKLGPRITVWKVEDIRALIEKGEMK